MARPVAALLLAAAVRPAAAQVVYRTHRDLLADFFARSERVTYWKASPTPAQRARIAERLGYGPARPTYTFYVGLTAGHVDGYALIDDENGQSLPITFAVLMSPDAHVVRQEVVVYREPRGDEVRDERFRRQFVGKTSRDPIRAGDDVVAISGATISSRAMAVGVRRALVLLEELVLRSDPLAQSRPPRPTP